MPLLSEIPAFNAQSRELQVVSETPKGSRNKYKYNSEYDCFELSHVLPEGMAFPFDFGFVPSTRADDGDPLDVLILSDDSFCSGSLIKVRLIGAITARQKERKGDWTRNDRLIAVPLQGHGFAGATNFTDLPPKLMDQLKAFFIQYNDLRRRTFEPLKDTGKKKSLQLIRMGMKKFQKN